MKKITLQWLEDQVMVGTDSNGRSIVIGRTADAENPWRGVKPAELLLMAAASCATWDVVEILHKQRAPLRDLRVETSGEQDESPPYSFKKIHSHYIAYGDLDPVKLEKVIRLAEDKYCSVISTLRLGIPVTSDFEIRP